MVRALTAHAKVLDDEFYGLAEVSLQELAFELTGRKGTVSLFEVMNQGQQWHGVRYT
jgi:hypothetical protein